VWMVVLGKGSSGDLRDWYDYARTMILSDGGGVGHAVGEVVSGSLLVMRLLTALGWLCYSDCVSQWVTTGPLMSELRGARE